MDSSLPPAAELQALEEFAVGLARQAGRLLLERFGQAVAVEYKGKKATEPVTATDRDVETLLREAIGQRYPDHDVLGEETSALLRESPYLWVLDPLDGTANFVGGLPMFAVSLGLLYRGRPVAAGLFLPASSAFPEGVYHARRGAGAFFEGEPLAVGTSSRLCGLSLGTLRQFRGTRAMRRRRDEARSLGSICYELATVARGTFQYAVFTHPRLWDVAAGILLVTEAGGQALHLRRGHWELLEVFEPPPKGYREWAQPVMAGAPEAVAFLRRNLRPARRPWEAVLKRFFR